MPTVTISSSFDIEDNYLVGVTDLNYGGYAWAYCGTSNIPLMRIRTGALPAGNITAFRMFIGSMYANGSLVATAYRIAATNNWVGGTKSGSVETGSSCWDWLAYPSTPWAGNNGGYFVDGVDYISDASPPTGTITDDNAYHQFDLPPSWVKDWRDLVIPNNGFTMFRQSGSAAVYWETVNAGSGKKTYFEIDYTLSGGLPPNLLARRA